MPRRVATQAIVNVLLQARSLAAAHFDVGNDGVAHEIGPYALRWAKGAGSGERRESQEWDGKHTAFRPGVTTVIDLIAGFPARLRAS